VAVERPLAPHASAAAAAAAANGADEPAPAAPAGFGPRVTAAEANALPAKLVWSLVAWYRVAGEYGLARELIAGLEGRSGESAQGLEERARLALAEGRSAEAVALFEARVERAPSATAKAALARLLLEVGDLDGAAAVSDELCREAPELLTVGALAADLARRRGDLATARAYHEGVLADRPGHVNSLLALARLAVLGGDHREAGELLDRALAAGAGSGPQLGAAAAIAELVDRPGLAAALRRRIGLVEARAAATLAAAVDEGLGRSAPSAPAPPALDAGTDSWGEEDGRRRAPATRLLSRIARGTPAEPDAAERAPRDEDVSPQEWGPESRVGGAERGAEGAEPVAAVELPETPVEPRVAAALRDLFGHEALRPGQAAVIANVLAGRDTLAIMSSGAGKSLTFQLPAMLREGVTLVISPLIALMKDQVEGLPPAVRERTALVNSTLSAEEQRRVLAGVGEGDYKLVYAAPERLRQGTFLRALRAAGVGLVVVDEAHCISLWGHDFRPDYLGIPSALPELGDPPVLAITATATPRMAKGIEAGFGKPLSLVRTSVFRPNLFYEVHRLAKREEKVAKVVAIGREEKGAGIVYVSSRKDAEAIAGVLRDRGVGAIPYHAGLEPATRARNQERFMAGQVRVVVATVAFGMGVDKRDVRFIVHLSPPRSLEAYAQESGRAGRDGEPARCVLLTSPTDQASLNRLARRDELDLGTLRRVYAGVMRAATGSWALLDPSTLLPPPFDDEPEEAKDPRIALGLLEQADLVRRHPDAPLSYTVGAGGGEGEAGDGREAELWQRFLAWSGLAGGGADRGPVTIRTADACEALGVAPLELGRLLGARGAMLREGPRLVCLELRPVGSDAAMRLEEILARARAESQRRVAQVMAYAAGGRCRHAILAGHLGERLEPCGTACDVCTGAVAAPTSGRRGRADGTGSASGQRTRATAEDALAVLAAVRTLPFPMGKTGLVRLLLGSVESRVRADRSPSFGVLAELKKGTIDGLIDRLVAGGFLHRDLDHEYKVIRLTERGAVATLDDVAGIVPAGRLGPAGAGGEDDAPLGPEEAALLDRLHDWRRERASRDAVPAYVIAHNATLAEIARSRPRTAAELGQVKGFGPARVEKYGDEILRLVAGAGS